MAHYRRNPLRAEFMRLKGQTTGLPLFEAVGPTLSGIQAQRLAQAPKSIPVATDTKRLAHLLQKADPVRVSDQAQRVLEVIENEGPVTNKEIARRLGIDASTVAARNFELRELDKITKAGKRQCSVTGNIATQWRVK